MLLGLITSAFLVTSPIVVAEDTKLVSAPYDYEYLMVNPDELVKTQANIETLDQIFQAIFAQDWDTMRGLYADNYVQHNPEMRDGKEGVIDLFKPLNYETLVYEKKMSIAEGPYITALSKLQYSPESPELVVVDINFIRDGQSREHWDIIQPTGGKPNAAGRTLFESAYTDTVEVSPQTLTQNKQLVADMFNVLFNEKKLTRVADFFGETYYQHADGDDGYQSVLDDFRKFPDVQVDIKRIIGQNDLVLAHTKISTGGMDFSRADIYRVRDAKLVEHWAVMQPIPDHMEHRNGMF